MRKIRVLLAEDYATLREAWTIIFNQTEDIEVVDATHCIHEIQRSIKKKKTDLIVVDVNVPGIEKIDTILEISRQWPDVKVILLSSHYSLLVIRKVLQAGIRGYLTKFAALEELLLAIREVGRGGTYIEKSIRDKLAYADMLGETDPMEKLTNREFQVMYRIREGLNSKEVADVLGLSFKTVEVYRYNVYRKLSVNSLAELINYLQIRGM